MAAPSSALFPEITHLKKRKLLLRLALTGQISVRGQKEDWRMHWIWLEKDPVYAAAVKKARDIAGDMLEAEAHRRAFGGSDLLTIFLLKGAKPAKYRERQEYTGPDGGALEIRVVYASPPASTTPQP
jgi:hypothetical protein